MEYRKRKDKDAWHWCTNCSNWPTANFVKRDSKPTSDELCNQCKSKEASETCTKKS